MLVKCLPGPHWWVSRAASEAPSWPSWHWPDPSQVDAPQQAPRACTTCTDRVRGQGATGEIIHGLVQHQHIGNGVYWLELRHGQKASNDVRCFDKCGKARYVEHKQFSLVSSPIVVHYGLTKTCAFCRTKRHFKCFLRRVVYTSITFVFCTTEADLDLNSGLSYFLTWAIEEVYKNKCIMAPILTD